MISGILLLRVQFSPEMTNSGVTDANLQGAVEGLPDAQYLSELKYLKGKLRAYIEAE